MITERKRLALRRKKLARKGQVGLRNCKPKPNTRTRGGVGWNHIVPGGGRMLQGFMPRGTANRAHYPDLTPYQAALESGAERTGRWHPAGVSIGPIECGEFNGEKIITRSRKAQEKARMSYNVAVQHGIVREN